LTFKPWKLESVLQMLLGVFGGIALAGFLAAGLGYVPQPGEIDHVMMIVSAISFHGVGLIWLHWLVQDHGWSWGQVLGGRSPRVAGVLVTGILAGVAGFFICMQISNVVLRLMTHFEMPPEAQVTVQALQSTVSWPLVIMFGLLFVIIGPLVEEFIFRGLLYPVLKQLGFPVAAWLTSTLVFGVIHANLQALLPLTVLAVLLTVLYERTDNLLAPFVAHAVFNGINFALALKYGAFSTAGAAT